MKKIFNYVTMGLIIAAAATSCKVDNYPAPDQTLQGTIFDAGTNAPVQSEVSGDNGSGTRIKLLETSWSANPTPLYLATKQDGTYINTKVFAATYKVTAEGAFVPMVQTDATGKTTVDQSQTIELKGGSGTVNFKVEPFLEIQWVGDPVYNAAAGTVTAQVKITRGTANTAFQQEVTDLWLFVNNSSYVGNNNYDARYSTHIGYSGTTGNSIIGQTLTITTTATSGKLPTARDLYFRIGARINYGLKQYNYNEPKMVTIP